MPGSRAGVLLRRQVTAAAVEDSTGSGSPVATLSATASGTAVQKFVASGTATNTLSATASGTAVQKFVGSGTPTKTLEAFASGTASSQEEPDPISGSGIVVTTLSAFASGTAVNMPPQRRRVLGVWVDEEKEDEELELVLQGAEESPEPVFPPLPAVTPTRPIAWAKLAGPKLSEKRTSISDTISTRRKRQEQEMIHLIMAGAA